MSRSRQATVNVVALFFGFVLNPKSSQEQSALLIDLEPHVGTGPAPVKVRQGTAPCPLPLRCRRRREWDVGVPLFAIAVAERAAGT